jgi:hypothetical protein
MDIIALLKAERDKAARQPTFGLNVDARSAVTAKRGGMDAVNIFLFIVQ